MRGTAIEAADACGLPVMAHIDLPPPSRRDGDVGRAAELGLGTGGVFAWVGRAAPAKDVGTIGGIIAAAGGLGGYVPPLVMGATYDAENNSYFVGLTLLAAAGAIDVERLAPQAHAAAVLGLHEGAYVGAKPGIRYSGK